jgi:hypothetical protein
MFCALIIVLIPAILAARLVSAFPLLLIAAELAARLVSSVSLLPCLIARGNIRGLTVLLVLTRSGLRRRRNGVRFLFFRYRLRRGRFRENILNGIGGRGRYQRRFSHARTRGRRTFFLRNDHGFILVGAFSLKGGQFILRRGLSAQQHVDEFPFSIFRDGFYACKPCKLP